MHTGAADAGGAAEMCLTFHSLYNRFMRRKNASLSSTMFAIMAGPHVGFPELHKDAETGK